MLFYLWLLTSIVILVRRMFVKRRDGDADGATSAINEAGSKPAAAKTSKKTGTTEVEPKASARLRPGRPAGPEIERSARADRVGRARADQDAGDDGSLVQAVIREEIERKRRELDEPSGRAGLFAPLPGDDATGPGGGEASDGSDDRPTVADALTGITLPCDLAPMILDALDPDPHRVVFVTVGFEARIVGAKLADELERLGYDLDSASATTATARRDDVLVTIELFEDADQVREGGARLFPSAPGGSVAVEITT